MGSQTITINISDDVYQQIQRAAERRNRSVGDLMAEAITAAAPAFSEGSRELEATLANMAYMNDAFLWQMARASMTSAQQDRLEALHYKQQQMALEEGEEEEMERLESLYRDTLLMRAQAAVLLKQRNYDVSDPEQFAPLE